LEGFLHYCDYTAAPLMRLVCKVLGVNEVLEPFSLVANNYALAGILRATVSFAKERRCYLPQELMNEHNVRVNQLYELKKQDGLRNVVERVAGQFVDGVSCGDRVLKAQQHLAKLYMGQLRRMNYDVFHPRMQLPPAFKALRILLNL